MSHDNDDKTDDKRRRADAAVRGRRLFAITFVFLFAVTLPRLAAQTFQAEEVLRASHIGWVGSHPVDDEALVVQTGFELRSVWRAGQLWRFGDLVSLPPTTGLFDVAGKFRTDDPGRWSVFVVTPTKSWILHAGAPTSSREPAGKGSDLLHGPPTSPPARLPLVRGERVVTPEVDKVHAMSWPFAMNTPSSTLPIAASDRRYLGWGLGYRMTSSATVPALIVGDATGNGQDDLLVRRRDSIEFFPSDRDLLGFDVAGRRTWAKAPPRRVSELLGFEHEVPPLDLDFDGDGVIDLILTDPESGTLFSYRGAGRATSDEDSRSRQPDQTLRISGWLLWRWLVDMDGDGRRDLVLLRAPKPNLLAQLRIVTKGKMRVEVSVHVQNGEGRFRTAVAGGHAFDLPVVLSITRTQRRVEFRAPVMPIERTGRRTRLLVPGDDGSLGLLELRDGDDFEPRPAGTFGIGAKSWIARPFDPIAVTTKTSDDLALVVRSGAGEGDRLTILREAP